MQSELLDIIITGCLVLLFAGTYRKRTTSMVQLWTIGWVLVLFHFTALLFHPSNSTYQKLLITLSLIFLIACGMVFLLAIRNNDDVREPPRITLLIAGLGASGIVALQVWEVTATLPYWLLVIGGGAFWYPYAASLRRIPILVRSLLVVSTLANTYWLFWTILHHRPDVGISAILTQLFLSVGLVYLATFRRLSGGTCTMIFGMLAWAAVFPIAELLAHLGLFSQFSPELWNIPKYFVAFGMILFLLEEEMAAVNTVSDDYRLLFDANPHPMWTYDLETLAFEKVNDAAIAQYGYSREEFLRMTVRDLYVGGYDEDFPQKAQSIPRNQKFPGTLLHKRRDGSRCFVEIASHRIRSNGRNKCLTLIQDVTERRELHERLFHQANYDLLTGLANRPCFEEKLRAIFSDPERQDRLTALLCLDVDRFKQVNDTYGHGVGDACLQEVAKRLSTLIRKRGSVARVGGEEFSLLLDKIEDAAEADSIATEILTTIQTPILAKGFWIELTASIGIAIAPADGLDASALWRNADAAMFRAKQAGGNQFLSMSAEGSQLAAEANEMEILVRRALREGGLEVHYQPLYTIEGELDSLEALVRLRDLEGKLVSPALFIPVAEERGLIVPVGSWVVNEVCRQTSAWQHDGLSTVNVALNVSPLQITRPDFAQYVVDMLATHNLDPRLLGIEITETAMMRNVGEASRQIEILANFGIAFSVDDFGTGYSSFGQIDKLSVQRLKIDRTFIERIAFQEGTYSIVEAMILMAHSLHLEVVAEGVETQEQWDCLRQLNCDVVQGFLFSRPLHADAIPAVLRKAEETAVTVRLKSQKALQSDVPLNC
jgi:diguanylate cyclase (GGDEF)-like protein/PAS domain S-box-containing protein